jgi:FdhD protein
VARRVVDRRTIVAVRNGAVARRQDALAGEEPMEIRVNGVAVSVTMRTPGNDFELALGFCLTEGIVDDPHEVVAIRYCVGEEDQEYNVVDVGLVDRTPVPESLRRNVYTTSSCGLCGSASIEAVRKRVPDVSDDDLQLTPEVVAGLPDTLRTAQRVFDRTGGLHAAAAFTPDGGLVCLREDVGRHNAVDKVIGTQVLMNRLPLDERILFVSGRTSFEIVQKAVVAGIPLVASVSAPSSLAIELAEDANITLLGFVRGTMFNAYTGLARLNL